MGAYDYVVKPFSPTELVARVKAVLRRRTASEPAVPYVVGDLTINYGGTWSSASSWCPCGGVCAQGRAPVRLRPTWR